MVAKPSGKIDLFGQTAIVTGAAGGIGRAVALSLAREGANVVVSDISPLENVVAEVEITGRKSIAVRCDVTRPDDVNHLIEVTERTFGRIDILVTCAGICERTTAENISTEEWDLVQTVDLKGTFLCMQAVYPKMKASGYGKIVAIGSVAGRVGGVISGPHYVAAKGGIHSLVKWFAKDGAPYNVYVNAVAPGPVRTNMTEGFPYRDDMAPLERLGEPEDIAEAVVFLASQASNWITGITLDVNGGMLMT